MNAIKTRPQPNSLLSIRVYDQNACMLAWTMDICQAAQTVNTLYDIWKILQTHRNSFLTVAVNKLSKLDLTLL